MLPQLADIDPGEFHAFLGQPHFADIRGGVAHLDDGEFGTFWALASPVIERMINVLGFDLDEGKEWVLANRSVAIAIYNENGEIQAAGLMQSMDLAELPSLDGGALVALIGCAGEWPDLSELERIMDSASASSGGRPLVIWSNADLPNMEGWTSVELSVFPGRVLIRPGKVS